MLTKHTNNVPLKSNMTEINTNDAKKMKIRQGNIDCLKTIDI